MTRNKKLVWWMAATIALAGASLTQFLPSVSAQAAPQAGAAPAPQPQKVIKTRFEVLRMMYTAIQVRGLADMREIHTFTYAPEIRDQMQKLFGAGGYQYGDKVVVWYEPSANVAVKIKGKPSKPK